jgi:hypothetical protein
MKTQQMTSNRGGLYAALFTLAALGAAKAQITVDGVRDGSDTGYTERAVQQTTTGWGNDNALANLHTAQDGANLAVFIAGKPQGNAILLFIDSKPGGVSFIPKPLINSGGEENTINNLGTSPTAGLTFEPGFEPDFVVRVFGDGNGIASYVNRYNLLAGTRNYVGEAGTTSPAASDFVTAIRSAWASVPPPYAGITTGVEMKLSLAGLGVPFGASQPVKLMAVLVNGNSDYASNQVLASRNGPGDIGGGINAINFGDDDLDPVNAIQTISLTVDNVDTDNDGLPNNVDPDDDNDGLDDTVETDSGTYNSPADTGTNPLVVDSDADGASDFAEINAPLAFGFLSNPNIPTFASMAVPGSYTNPQWQVDGSAGNAMTRVGTSLADQNSWTLDFKMAAPGEIQYKYAANGSYTNSWGAATPSGNYVTNIAASGFHRFAFNNVPPVVGSLTRITYATEAEYLAAYGVAAGDNTDGDAWTAAEEYLANTDPTNGDSDGDTIPDHLDAAPLVAELVTRDIVFTVNMNVQDALGNFTLGFDDVVVDFFDGTAGSLPDLVLADEDSDGIYTGTLTGFTGSLGSSFGTYKFKNTRVGAPSNGYEGSIDNRSFIIVAGGSPLVLPTVFFDNNNGFSGWAAANAGGQGAAQDFDGDGVANGVEYFMGQTGSSFTPNPQPVGGVIAWPHSATAVGATFKVWISDNLSTWTDKTVDAVDAGGFVTYTLPVTDPKLFVRLEVVTP